MNFDKILKIVVVIGLIGYIVIMSFPDLVGYFYEAKDVIKNYDTVLNDILLNSYLDSKPNYYFKYEGATYCLSVQSLIDENYINEDKVEDKTAIIEAYYDGVSYSFKFNKECVEK